MELVGLTVIHKVWKTGTIVGMEKGTMTIDFPAAGTKRMIYPTAFDVFLKFADGSAQEQFDKEKAEMRAAEEAAKKAAEDAKRAAEEAARKATEEATRKGETATAPGKRVKFRKRVTGVPFTYLVFQGGTFSEESTGNFIWAPKYTSAGTTLHHWDRLMEVRPGDVIFHCADGYIRAISQVVSECVDCERPGTFEEWEKEGRRVDCNYYVLGNPIKHGDYKSKILDYCGVKYSPFDKDGNGNMGYLFELHEDLAKFFMSKIQAANPDVGALSYTAFLM